LRSPGTEMVIRKIAMMEHTSALSVVK